MFKASPFNLGADDDAAAAFIHISAAGKWGNGQIVDVVFASHSGTAWARSDA